jgi:hypothetical protein
MKTKIVIKLLLVLAFGTCFGLVTQRNHEKWHGLGRDAYLAEQSRWFDKKMATPSNTQAQVIEWALIACLIGGAYECVAYVGATLLTRNKPVQNQ